MKKFNIYTDDADFLEKLKKIVNKTEYNILNSKAFYDFENLNTAYVHIVDIEDLGFIKKSIDEVIGRDKGLILLCDTIEPKESVDLLNSGISAIIFKSEKEEEILKIITKTYENISYLKELKVIVDNNKKLNDLLVTLKSLTSDKDISEIIRTIMQTMFNTFDLKSISFNIIKKNKIKNRFAIGDNISIDVNLTKKIKDILYNKEIKLISKKEFRIKEYGKFIYIPLFLKSELFGFILADYNDDKDYDRFKEDIEIFKAFGEQISLAIENARLYWDIMNAKEELIKKEKESLLAQMIVSLNHEINNPLTIISMEAQLLQRKIKEEKTANINNRLSRIENNIERIKIILEKISSLKTDKNNVIEYIKGKKMINLYDEN